MDRIFYPSNNKYQTLVFLVPFNFLTLIISHKRKGEWVELGVVLQRLLGLIHGLLTHDELGSYHLILVRPTEIKLYLFCVRICMYNNNTYMGFVHTYLLTYLVVSLLK